MKVVTVTREGNELIWQEQERAIPEPEPHQYLVKVMASSVNPADCKVASKLSDGETSRVLGWDAVAEIVSGSEDDSLPKSESRVWYLGSVYAEGCQAEYQIVDRDLTAPVPKNLSHVQAASLPLTGVTALELLLDKLHYQPKACPENMTRPLLIINGAGGVGSILIQICKHWGIPVTASASREQSQEWCYSLGASKVVKHSDLSELEADQFAAIVCAHDTDRYFSEMIRLASPFGNIVALSGAHQNHNVQALMAKSISFGFEFVFTRVEIRGEERRRHAELLRMLSELVESRVVKCTTNLVLWGLSALSVKEAHDLLLSQKVIGKVVIDHTYK